MDHAHGVFIFDHNANCIKPIFDNLTSLYKKTGIGIKNYHINNNYVKFTGSGEPTFTDWLQYIITTPILKPLCGQTIQIDFNECNDDFNYCCHERGKMIIQRFQIMYHLIEHIEYPYTLSNLIKLGCKTND